MTKIAEERKKAGLTQQGLAEAVGVTQGAVAHWESGRREAPVPMLRKIAKALGIEVARLI